MQLSEKDYAEFKKICEKEGVKYDTEEEYRESANNLYRYAELALELAREQYLWEMRLKKEPKGFAIKSEGRSCCLCHTSVMGEVWYDKWGMKCMTCQSALDKKIVPGYVFNDSDNNRHVTASQLNWKYGIHPQTIKKLIRLNKLKPRIIPNGVTLFLRRENPKLPEIIRHETRKRKSILS